MNTTPTPLVFNTPLPPAPPTPTPLPPPGSEPPMRLLIPSIGVDTEVVGVDLKIIDQNGVISREWETAEYVAGHHAGSANPGGQGNVVISGHNNIFGRVFRLLERVKPDDEIILETGTGQRYRYVVVEQVIVPEAGVTKARRQENASYMAQTEDYRVTLISCWPYWTNTHRVIVVAELVE
jgi:sortase A